MQATILVLASGRGERFLASGGTTHKLQADLAGKTVLQHTLDAVRASGLPWHLEDGGHPGMGDSIAAAVCASAQSTGWLILPADLPLVQSATLRAIAAALEGCDAVVPVYAGQRGHPVGFSARCRDALLNLSGSRGAASVLLAYRSTECVVADPGCVMDIDTVDDLIAAHKFLQQGLGRAIQP